MTRTAKKKRRSTASRKSLPGSIVGSINGFPIRRVRVSEITGAEYNPRKITRAALKGLKKSVTEFGLPQAIVWNKRTQRVVGGHQRLKTLSPTSVTDIVEVDLDAEREKALNVALNNPHISGEFTDGLESILATIKTEIPDLSTDLRLDLLSAEVEPKGGDGKKGSKPNTKSDSKGRNKLVWNLEITFPTEKRRSQALKALQEVGEETLAQALEEVLLFYHEPSDED